MMINMFICLIIFVFSKSYDYPKPNSHLIGTHDTTVTSVVNYEVEDDRPTSFLGDLDTPYTSGLISRYHRTPDSN